MRIVLRRILILLWVTTLGSNLVWAEEKGQSPPLPGSAVVFGLHHRPTIQVLRAINMTLHKQGQELSLNPYIYSGNDSGLHSPIVLALEAERKRAKEACANGSRPIADLLSKARSDLDFLDDAKAQKRLEQVASAFSCEKKIVSSAQVAEYFFLLGILEHHKGYSPQKHFEAALLAEPNLSSPAQYSDTIVAQFAVARKSALTRERISLQLAPTATGETLMIDGRPAAEMSAGLPPGPHFLQLVQGGEPVLSGIEDLKRPETGGPVLWPPERLRPAKDLELTELFQPWLREESPDPMVASAVNNFLRAGQHPLLLIVQDTRPDGTVPYAVLRPDNTPVLGAVRVDVQNPSSHARGVVSTLAFGALALTSAGVYGYYYLESTREDVLWPQKRIDYVVGMQILGDVGMGVGVTGALISAGLTWGPGSKRAQPISRLSIAPRWNDAGNVEGLRISMEALW